MTDRPLRDKEKQFTVLQNEADPKNALIKAHQAFIVDPKIQTPI